MGWLIESAAEDLLDPGGVCKDIALDRNSWARVEALTLFLGRLASDSTGVTAILVAGVLYAGVMSSSPDISSVGRGEADEDETGYLLRGIATSIEYGLSPEDIAPSTAGFRPMGLPPFSELFEFPV